MTTKAQAFGLFLQEKYSEALDAFRDLATEDFSMRINQVLCAAILKQPDWRTTDILLNDWELLPAPGLIYLAEIFLASENAPQALKFIDTAIAKDPANIQAYLTRIDVLETLGDGDGVLETLEKIFPAHKNDARVLCAVAGYDVHYGQYGQSGFLLKQALKINRLYTLFQEDFYDCFLTMGKERQLLPFAAEALKIRPENPAVLYALAAASALTGKTEKADGYFRQLAKDFDVLPDKLKSMWADALFGEKDYVRAFDTANGISADYAFKDGIKTFKRKALYLMMQNNPDEARVRAEKWRDETPDDPLIVHCCAAILGEKDKPTPPPEAIRDLFDEFAADFEDVLIGNLKYSGNDLLNRALSRDSLKKIRFSKALDAGCGTGLQASVIKRHLKENGMLTGVDVSGLMLDEARKKAVYSELVQQDIVSYCNGRAEEFDLIVCMDVSSYFGDLTPLFKSFSNALTAKGTALFSVLTENGGDDFALQPGGQYKHSAAFVGHCLEQSGLKTVSAFDGVLRYELDKPENCRLFQVEKK